MGNGIFSLAEVRNPSPNRNPYHAPPWTAMRSCPFEGNEEKGLREKNPLFLLIQQDNRGAHGAPEKPIIDSESSEWASLSEGFLPYIKMPTR